METTAVTITDNAQEIARGFHEEAALLEAKYNKLRLMPTGTAKAAVAKEFAVDAKKYIDLINNSELQTQSSRLHQAHRFWTGILKKAKAPGEILLKYCNDIRSDWETERRRIVEAERQKREEQANLFATKAREAEVLHLVEIGKKEEAEVRAAAPIIPITVHVDPNLGKPAGESLNEVWVPKRDDRGEIVFTDLTAYLTWIAANPAMHYLIDHKYGKLKKWLTDNRGVIQPPGLVIEHKFEPRTRASDETDSR